LASQHQLIVVARGISPKIPITAGTATDLAGVELRIDNRISNNRLHITGVI